MNYKRQHKIGGHVYKYHSISILGDMKSHLLWTAFARQGQGSGARIACQCNDDVPYYGGSFQMHMSGIMVSWALSF
eukprot:2433974-Amphidinium_carterae.1